MSRTHDLRSWLRHVPVSFDQFRRRVLDKVDDRRARVALAAFSTSRTATVAEALATWESEGGGLGHLKARALPGGARGPQARSPGGSVRQ